MVSGFTSFDRPSTPPTPTFETAATGATMENGYHASVLSGSFIAAQESPPRAARENVLKSRSLVASLSVDSPAPASRPKGVPNPSDRWGYSGREKLLPVLRQGANSPDVLDIIRRGREGARLMNPNSRRRRSTGVRREPQEMGANRRYEGRRQHWRRATKFLGLNMTIRT